MATTWPASRVPFLDANGDPMVGAKLYFYDSNTTTPQSVYSEASLSTTIDQPVLADARGMFPAIYLNPDPGSYRQKLTDADDVLIFDDDEISVPQAATYVPPDAGATSVDLLARTGDLKPFYGTSSIPSGWVRANGRTLGSATSGATERANADAEDLFLHLWTEDSTLSVSSGRGGSAAGDWAANKTIALPDFRERTLVGLATMGNSDAGLVADSLVDGGETSSTLGATAGADDVALTEANLAAHDHDAGELLMPNHGHPVRTSVDNADSSDLTGGVMLRGTNVSTKVAYTGTPSDTAGQQVGGSGTASITGSTADAGSGTAHNNMQPSMFVSILIKL